ncbi:phosphatidylserine/phosphatidylglycerophosphate/cardiolipin synthase family protein [Jeongeupia wiesaeckerbachi]|uniref:phospholipase D-like domain-containing protein n=1 Tax=Jeongeupia wiesaeckerbachi TaxID=3051218 RepID=UPI003D8023E4
MNKPYVCPIDIQQTKSAQMHAAWFVNEKNTENDPREATFLPLNCGEAAFAEVHKAIAAATKSVDIICWGFQPSMYFIRDGKSPCIGQLLMDLAAKRNVEVRVLGWTMEVGGANVAQWGPENNTPGQGMFSRAPTETREQHNFDRNWFFWVQRGMMPRVQFVGRGFGPLDRLEILYRAQFEAADRQLSKATKASLTAFATHHQKMVLVDYAVPDKAVGFVMGHNMLDEYWDKPNHSVARFAPNLGRNGQGPRQDISSRVTGPILKHLHDNFAQGWKDATGEDLDAKRNSKAVATQFKPRCDLGTPCMAQILRTQSQHGRRDIEKLYLKAVNNATQYIYLENQYFRWPHFAEKIKAVADKLTNGGRDPGPYGSLHLFVVTNSTDEGMGDGTVKTYEMLESLGKADTIPGVARQERADDLEARLGQQDNKVKRLGNLPNPAVFADGKYPPAYDKQLEDLKKAKTERDNLKKQLAALQDTDAPITIEAPPGLKVHVCTLVAPDSSIDRHRTRQQHAYAMGSTQEVTVPAPDLEWTPVYIHSKLMLIDDVFMTLGSANINTRSMQVDSELNIAHQNGKITQGLRLELWNQHTNGKGAQMMADKAYEQWQKVINDNKRNQAQGKQPIAPLVEFYRGSPVRTNKD